MTDDLATWLRAQLDDDERVAREASHVLRNGACWSLDEWHGRERPHSLIAQGTADQPVALGHFTADPVPTEQATHIARHDPARVLREIEAKRRIVDLFEEAERRIDHFTAPDNRLLAATARNQLATVLKLLALPYADRPGYKEEWKP